MSRFLPLPAVRPEVPTCAACGKTADELIPADFAEAVMGIGHTPTDLAVEDGTYNELSHRFLCDACYVADGMPTGPAGWRVDDFLDASPY
jgi:hypothetical protein